jgi:4'-phosphopantetheinyl transferase EntD
MRLAALENSIGCNLQRDVAIASADADFALTPLSGPECIRFSELNHAQRKNDWLRGRNAMKQVLLTLGRNTDTSLIEFPHRQFSLTHAGASAFSIGLVSGCAGIGIDYEPVRAVDPQIARLFLNDPESRWLGSCQSADVQQQIVRLWTIKEAAFKSHPANSGMVLANFSVVEPGCRDSDVTVESGAWRMRVACLPHDQGFLSVAICEEALP